MKPINRKAFTLALLLAPLVGAYGQASAQTNLLKTKPIRIVVAAPAGTAPDLVARLLGEKFRIYFGQSAIVDNRTGAGGIVAVNSVKGAVNDGLNLLLAQAAVAVVTPLTYKEAKYDIETDFETVAALASTPMLFVSNITSGPKTWGDALKEGKSQSEKLSLGNPFRTSIPHLAGELVGQLTGARFLHVPMGTTGQGIQGVISGDTQMYVDGVAPLLQLVKAGRIRALAVTSKTEMPGLEGIPLARSQVPGFDVSGWFVLFAPKGTPKDVIDELNKAANDAMNSPDVMSKLRDLGTYPIGGTVAEAKAFVRSEKKVWSEVIQNSGLKPE